jgi:hypothetical protein
MQFAGSQPRLMQALFPYKVQHQEIVRLTSRIRFEVLIIGLTGKT